MRNVFQHSAFIINFVESAISSFRIKKISTFAQNKTSHHVTQASHPQRPHLRQPRLGLHVHPLRRLRHARQGGCHDFRGRSLRLPRRLCRTAAQGAFAHWGRLGLVGRCGLFGSGTRFHHVLADGACRRPARFQMAGHQRVALFGIFVACFFCHPLGQVQHRRHADHFVPRSARPWHGHLHRFFAFGARPSGTSHGWRFGLLGLPWHHHGVLVHDGEPPAFLLVQDEIGKMERQRGALDLPLFYMLLSIFFAGEME